jgi:hypothetical protein
MKANSSSCQRGRPLPSWRWVTVSCPTKYVTSACGFLFGIASWRPIRHPGPQLSSLLQPPFDHGRRRYSVARSTPCVDPVDGFVVLVG